MNESHAGMKFIVEKLNEIIILFNIKTSVRVLSSDAVTRNI